MIRLQSHLCSIAHTCAHVHCPCNAAGAAITGPVWYTKRLTTISAADAKSFRMFVCLILEMFRNAQNLS